jgi:hypothetical protein
MVNINKIQWNVPDLCSDVSGVITFEMTTLFVQQNNIEIKSYEKLLRTHVQNMVCVGLHVSKLRQEEKCT